MAFPGNTSRMWHRDMARHGLPTLACEQILLLLKLYQANSAVNIKGKLLLYCSIFTYLTLGTLQKLLLDLHNPSMCRAGWILPSVCMETSLVFQSTVWMLSENIIQTCLNWQTWNKRQTMNLGALTMSIHCLKCMDWIYTLILFYFNFLFNITFALFKGSPECQETNIRCRIKVKF